ncbi:MAG: TVP38/TMEM64 family protein [Acetobacteraceae bacterium]|nr:TVP38/TMEM64 family protein [Acetobacteraceae bacterium]
MRYLKPLLIALVLAGLALAAWHSGLGETLSWRGIARHQTRLVGLVGNHPVLAALIYWVVYTAWVAVSIPEASLLSVLGGLLFGTVLGGSIAVAGATTGAVIIFLIARSTLAGAMRRRAGTLLDRIRPGLHRDGFSYLLALRLVPTPFWLVNLAAAVCGMRLLPFAAATLVGIIPATYVLAWVGTGVGDVLASGRSPDLGLLFSARVLGPLAALAALSLLPVAWRWMRRGR